MPDQNNQPVGDFTPMIFVGLGSTGAKIVSRIEKRVAASKDPMIRRFVRCVNVTSESNAEPGVASGVPRRTLSPDIASPRVAVDYLATKVASSKQRDEFKKWWPMEGDSFWIPPVADTTTGAGGMRSVGRLLLHINGSGPRPQETLIAYFRSLAKEINESIERLEDHEKAQVSAGHIHCVVFGLLAGGTCSGTLLDWPVFLRQAFSVDDRGELIPGRTITLNGVFLLGDVCYVGAATTEQNWLRRNLQINNTRYALAELFFTATKTGQKICLPEWVSQVGVESFREDSKKFFDMVTLVGAKNDAGCHYQKFDAYHDFLADFYASLLESKKLAGELVRVVDDMAMIANLEAENGAEPHIFSRIGRLGLRPPTEKSGLLIQEKVAESVSQAFKNADLSRDDELIDFFKEQTGSNGWAELLTPPAVSILSPEPLPNKKDELRQHWKDQKAAIDAHYAGFVARSKKGDLVKELDDVWKRVASCLEEISLNTLGQQAGKAFNLGSLTYFAKTLSGTMSSRLVELTGRVATLQSSIAGTGEGGTNLSKQFDENLDRQVEDFPEDKLLNRYRRKNWSGNNDLEESLRQYAQALREQRAAEREIAIQRLSISELEKIQMFAKLLGSACFETFAEIRNLTEKAFKEDKDRPELWVEILKDRESIEKVIVKPILNKPDDGGEGTCRDAISRQALAVWCSGGKTRLMGSWNAFKKAAEVEQRVDAVSGAINLPSLEQMKQVEGLSEQFKAAAKDLQRAIGASLEKGVQAQVAALTVWDILAYHVKVLSEKTGESADVLLMKLFKEYARKAQLFGKMSAQLPVVTTVRDQVICIGSVDGVNRCLELLGIDQPDFLSRLLTATFGQGYTLQTPATQEGQREFVIYKFQCGGLPVYAEGFMDSKNLLAKDSPEAGLDWKWSDTRFPGWIKKWWNQPQKPDYLNR